MDSEAFSNYDLTVALGTELAASLEDHDTLGRWMAHYIADLIRRADDAPEGPDRENLKRACATEILRLWSHRRTFQSEARPMRSFEPLYRALERLDPQRPHWAYFRLANAKISTEDETTTTALLAAAIAIEDAARNTVRELVLLAFQTASQAEAKWLELSKVIEDDESAFLDRLMDFTDDYATDRAQLAPADKQIAKTVKAITALARAASTAMAAMDGIGPRGD